jgi:hypothetical protein
MIRKTRLRPYAEATTPARLNKPTNIQLMIINTKDASAHWLTWKLEPCVAQMATIKTSRTPRPRGTKICHVIWRLWAWYVIGLRSLAGQNEIP